jgi:hypothetical protein
VTNQGPAGGQGSYQPSVTRCGVTAGILTQMETAEMTQVRKLIAAVLIVYLIAAIWPGAGSSAKASAARRRSICVMPDSG